MTYTITMSEAVTVNTTGGTPTLTLNDGGTATYTGGSGTNALTFSYTVRLVRTPQTSGDRSQRSMAPASPMAPATPLACRSPESHPG